MLFKGLQPITDMVSSMMSIFKEEKQDPKKAQEAAKNAPSFKEFAGHAKTFMENMIDGLTGNKGIEQIVDMFSKKGGLIDKIGPRTARMRGRLKSLTEVFSVMGSISELITNLVPLLKVSTNTAGDFGDEVGGVTEDAFGNQQSTAVLDDRRLSYIENTLRMMPTAFGEDGKYLIDAVNLFKKVMPHVKGLPKMDDASNKVSAISEVAKLFTDKTIQEILKGTVSLAIPGDMGAITKQFDVLKTFVSKSSEVAYRISGKTIGKDGIAAQITNAKQAIVEMGDLMKVAGAPTTVKAAFANGKLVVQHQMPKGVQAKVDVHVNINGASLAKSLTQSKSKFTKGGQKVVLGTTPVAGK